MHWVWKFRKFAVKLEGFKSWHHFPVDERSSANMRWTFRGSISERWCMIRQIKQLVPTQEGRKPYQNAILIPVNLSNILKTSFRLSNSRPKSISSLRLRLAIVDSSNQPFIHLITSLDPHVATPVAPPAMLENIQELEARHHGVCRICVKYLW